MVFDHRKNYLAPVRATLTTLVAPLQYLIDKPIELTQTLTTDLASRKALLAENASLRAQQLLLQAKLQKLITLQNENNQLRALLAAPLRIENERITAARLLAIDTEPSISEMILDKGQHAGVYIGQAVVDAHGIVGQIIQIGPLTSRVLSVTDLRSAVPVQNTRNGIRSIIAGQGSFAKLALVNMPTTADIKVGDLLVSSGLGGHYPEGYPVGTVTQIHHNPGEQFDTIAVTPSAQLDRNRQVLLIWPPKAPTIDAPASQLANKVVTKTKVTRRSKP